MFFFRSLCWPEEVLDGRLGGPGLVLMDPPYEPYNEYLTWNIYTIHMLLGSTLNLLESTWLCWLQL